jgi:DNA-binding beta-propeller fold protein YncE
VSPDGATVFVTGTSNGDFLTIAYRATTGERVWLARHGGTGEGTDVAYALDLTPDGTTVFVTGNSQTRPYSFESSDYLTVAYRADTGAKVWTRRFDGPNHLDDIAYSVAANPDGSSVFVAGTSRAWQQFHDSCQCYTWAYDYVTLAYDAETGDVAWARRRAHDDGSELVEPTRPVLAADTEGSRLFLTTTKFRVETGVDVATYAYDTATGRKLWGTRSAGPGIAEDTSESLIVSPDGATVVVVGATWDAGRSDFLTIAYRAASGMERWRRAYDGPDGLSDGARAVVVDPDGSTVFVTGGSQWGAPRPQGSDFATVAYAVASGAQRWVARYRPRDPADGYLGTTAEAIGVDPGGSAVFVTGTSTAPSFVGADFATVAYRGG